MKKILFAFLCFLTGTSFGQDATYRAYYAKALEAYKAKAYPKFYELIKEANALHPYHQGIQYQLGMAAALTGHPAEAISNLKKAILTDNSFIIEGLPDFKSLEALPDYKRLLLLQKELGQSVIHSDTAFTLKTRTLHCEGIDYDATNKVFYLGSIHERKIIKVSEGHVATDFCTSGFEGMTSIFGVKADVKRNLLWACSSPMLEMQNYDSTTRSAVFKFDLTTGKLLKKFTRPRWGKDGVFGDLVLSEKGEAFISDSQTNTIFIVNEKTAQLEPYFTSSEFTNIQGLTFSEKDKYLFISDYIKGLFRLEIKSKSLSEIKCNLEVSLKGIDGLCFYKNSLIAIQNGVNPLRSTRYFLDDKAEAIVKADIIDRKHPAFNEPTLGVVDHDTFYYIANSQWGGYDQQHHIKPFDQLQDIVILKSNLIH